MANGQRPVAVAAAKLRKNAAPIPNRYIVVLNDDSVTSKQVGALADRLTRAHGGTLGFTYENALRGFSVEMNEAQAEALSRNSQVAFVEEDTLVEGASTQANAPWPLDRLDQRDPAPNGSYTYASDGAGVNVYVIDGGIRYTHQEFGDRAASAYDYAGGEGIDCNGHGTHVAGIIGGNTYGVAKGAKLWSVRVLDCFNQAPAANILAGIDWLAGNHLKPAVANLSFASGVGNNALDLAVRNLIAAGVTTVVAAGNNNGDAGLRSPARVTEAITVAATDQNDTKTFLSNFGAVVDVFAPGAAIVSAHSTGDAAVATRTGTSSAAPHVAGLVARYLGARAGDAPDAVAQAIMNAATPGKVLNAPEGTPNLLAYAGITLSDDFNDNVRDTDKWGAPYGTDFAVAEQNGRLEITPGVSAIGSGGYGSATTIDLTDSRVSIEALSPQRIDNFAAYFRLYSPNGDWIAFGQGGQILMMRHRVNGVVSDTRITYDAAQHRFWRIRHNRPDDTVNWEVSPEGVTWTVLHSIPRPFSITNLQTLLTAVKHTATTPTQTITFDNLWHEANPTPPVVYADNFDDNVIDPAMWKIRDPISPTIVTEQNGRIEVTPQPNTVANNGLEIAGGFDFRDKTLQVEVQPASQAGAVYTSFKLYLDDTNGLVFAVGANRFTLDSTVNGVIDRTLLTWNAALRYWRFRHDIDANTVSFDTSADGVTWTARKTVAAGFPLHSLRAAMGASAINATNAAPGMAVFDNFRLERYNPLFPQSDNFNDNARDAKKWNAPTMADFTVAEQNGRLEITPGASSTGHDGYRAITNFDLTDARISVEAASVPGINSFSARFLLLSSNGDWIEFAQTGQVLMMRHQVNGVISDTRITYDAAQHRFWRLRHNRTGDTINWEVSPDGMTWTVLHSIPRPFSVTNLQTLLIAGKHVVTAPSATVVFDNLRIERNEGGKTR
ncbi:MAG TPA: S8 family peptidase [Pyrinomonadaceae bacterium]|nr:S8 family peptidase [Pyrinomonadaceae bacterium]